jgi:cellulose synthase/poly-beta-1,6-N-acetylglucosamine synthase-like glycosyltransferase
VRVDNALAVAFFLAGLAVPLYVLLVYPALLALLARWRPRPVCSMPWRTTVSVVIAVRNGERFIREKLRSVLALEYPRELLDILVVSDGSTDATDFIVREFAHEGVRLLRIPPSGKPAALNAAIPATRGEILLLTDVRQALAPGSLQLLVDCFADPSVGAASGRLVIRPGATRSEADVGLYWRYETWIRERLSRIDSTFGAVGPFYALRRDLAVRIPEDILLDDVYLPLAGYFRGYRLIVEGRAIAYDEPTTRAAEFRRKVRTLGGNYQILAAVPALLGIRNRMWFHFVSYKLGRLVTPYALLLAAASSLFLPGPWAVLAVPAEALFCLLGAIDALIPERALLKRLSSPVRTFLVLMLATICGLQVFFLPPQALWKETRAARA